MCCGGGTPSPCTGPGQHKNEEEDKKWLQWKQMSVTQGNQRTAAGLQLREQGSLSKTATRGPITLAFTERWLHYRGRVQCCSAMLVLRIWGQEAGCIIEVDCNVVVLFGARKAGCFREVAALYSDYYRQVSL